MIGIGGHEAAGVLRNVGAGIRSEDPLRQVTQLSLGRIGDLPFEGPNSFGI